MATPTYGPSIPTDYDIYQSLPELQVPYYTPTTESYAPSGSYVTPGSAEDIAQTKSFNEYVKEQSGSTFTSSPTISGTSTTSGTTLPATVPVAPTTPLPTIGEYPDIPELSEERMRYFTQRAARAPERALRRTTRKMIGRYDPNDPRYRYQMEGILGEFGSQLSNVYSQAGQTGLAEYQALEYQPAMTQWQADIHKIDLEFQSRMQEYMASFGQMGTFTPEGTTGQSTKFRYGVPTIQPFTD